MNGEPDYDLIECDPDRYSTWTDRKFLMEKARESYGMNTAPAFPKEERWAGRPTKRVSGAYEETKARGAGKLSVECGFSIVRFSVGFVLFGWDLGFKFLLFKLFKCLRCSTRNYRNK